VAGDRLRWKFDSHDGTLHAVTIGKGPHDRDPFLIPSAGDPVLSATRDHLSDLNDEQTSAAALWLVRQRLDSAGLRWPAVWHRLSTLGEDLLVEIDSFQPEFAVAAAGQGSDE
jgi:hypothetical protein